MSNLNETLNTTDVGLLGEPTAVEAYIMVTLTIPHKKIYKDRKYRKYQDMIPDEQREVIYEHVITLISKLKFLLTIDLIIDNFELVYELHKSGNLHAHAIIKINESCNNYEIHLIRIQKLWSQIVKGNNFSCKAKFVFDLNKAKEYVYKKPVFKDEIVIGLSKFIHSK